MVNVVIHTSIHNSTVDTGIPCTCIDMCLKVTLVPYIVVSAAVLAPQVW
jgi:hypothetical protein